MSHVLRMKDRRPWHVDGIEGLPHRRAGHQSTWHDVATLCGFESGMLSPACATAQYHRETAECNILLGGDSPRSSKRIGRQSSKYTVYIVDIYASVLSAKHVERSLPGLVSTIHGTFESRNFSARLKLAKLYLFDSTDSYRLSSAFRRSDLMCVKSAMNCGD